MNHYWHFTGTKLRDGRPIPPIGEWLIYEGPVEPCLSGLHASERPCGALLYAPGNILHIVELEGDLMPHGNPIDKWVGRRRKIIQSMDCEKLLRTFACDQALAVLPSNAPKIVRNYLENPMDENRDAARDAAWAAAWDAAWDEFDRRVYKAFDARL